MIAPRFARLAALALLASGCGGGDSPSPGERTGGSQGAGGATGSGGTPVGSGGIPTASGGTVPGGGPAAGFGGGVSSGGAASSGGTASTGGRPAGGAPSAGGIPAPDGSAPGPLTDDQRLVPDPSWACGLAAGIPPTQGGELVFETTFQFDIAHDVGQTQFGKRTLVIVKGGTVTGPKLRGTVLSGGLELALELSTGAVEVEQVHVLRATDGANIYLRTCGAAPAGASSARVVADFEAPSGGAHAFLNTGTFAGRREFDAAAKTLRLTVYDVSRAPPLAGTVTLRDPPGRHQSYDCARSPGTRTTVAYTETVGIGASVSVGASKRGRRNVIPITGGTTEGRVPGVVLPGGADYQILGSPFHLDARYIVKASDGTLIIVRNCGELGALVPTFETRADGPYAWLNEDRWVSSNPGIAAGAVNLTIYDTR